MKSNTEYNVSHERVMKLDNTTTVKQIKNFIGDYNISVINMQRVFDLIDGYIILDKRTGKARYESTLSKDQLSGIDEDEMSPGMKSYIDYIDSLEKRKQHFATPIDWKITKEDISKIVNSHLDKDSTYPEEIMRAMDIVKHNVYGIPKMWAPHSNGWEENTGPNWRRLPIGYHSERNNHLFDRERFQMDMQDLLRGDRVKQGNFMAFIHSNINEMGYVSVHQITKYLGDEWLSDTWDHYIWVDTASISFDSDEYGNVLPQFNHPSYKTKVEDVKTDTISVEELRRIIQSTIVTMPWTDNQSQLVRLKSYWEKMVEVHGSITVFDIFRYFGQKILYYKDNEGNMIDTRTIGWNQKTDIAVSDDTKELKLDPVKRFYAGHSKISESEWTKLKESLNTEI